MAEPYCLSMLLCDGVHHDPGTGKFFVLGTFSTFSAKAFPAKIRFCTYFAITDGLGAITIRLQLVSAAGEPIDALNEESDPNRIFMLKVEKTFDNPLAVMEGVFGVETVLPTPGLYHCELWGNSEVLMSRRLTAALIPGGNDKEAEE